MHLHCSSGLATEKEKSVGVVIVRCKVAYLAEVPGLDAS